MFFHGKLKGHLIFGKETKHTQIDEKLKDNAHGQAMKIKGSS